MRIRLNDDGTLRPVVIEQGWLGANYNQSQGGREYTGDQRRQSLAEPAHRRHGSTGGETAYVHDVESVQEGFAPA